MFVVWLAGTIFSNAQELDAWSLSGDLFETESLNELTVEIDEGTKVALTVKLSHYPEQDHPDFSTVMQKTADGQDYETMLYKGEALEPYQYPGGTYVSGFDLKWNGKKIDIPKMFWNDLNGVFAQKLKLLRKPASEAEQAAFDSIDEKLYRPRLSLSSSAGTLLISWQRPEE